MLENKRINATLFAKIKIFMKKPALPSSVIPEERNFNRENNIMKVSKKQQKIQKKINQLLLAGIPLATLIPLQASAQAPENKGIPTPGEPVRPIKTNIKVETQIHIVQAGETMTKIARMYNSSISEICRLNGIAIKDAGKLKRNQKLLVPKRNRIQEKKPQVLIGCIAAPENSVNEDKKPALRGIPKK